jgi:hypothetical protein
MKRGDDEKMKIEIDGEKMRANECPKATVGYYHRWEVKNVPTMHASNAVPELESGAYLPALYVEVLLNCKKCGAGLWIDLPITTIDVEEFHFME